MVQDWWVAEITITAATKQEVLALWPGAEKSGRHLWALTAFVETLSKRDKK
jgi:hypothetical protein